MQDEVNEKTIALYIKTGKLTAQTLQKAMKAILSRPFPSVHVFAPFLSVPRVWDTSQQAIFNRRAAAQEGENTERVPLSYACYESFSLLPTTELHPILPNFRKRKTLQSQKRLQRSLNPVQF